MQVLYTAMVKHQAYFGISGVAFCCYTLYVALYELNKQLPITGFAYLTTNKNAVAIYANFKVMQYAGSNNVGNVLVGQKYNKDGKQEY